MQRRSPTQLRQNFTTRPREDSGVLAFALGFAGRLIGGKRMKRSRFGIAAMVGGFVGEWACSAAAQSAYAADSAFLKVLTERVDFTVHQIPALGRHLWQLPNIVDGRTFLLLLGIVVAGLAAEAIVRLALNRVRVRTIDRLVGRTPLGAFGAAL